MEDKLEILITTVTFIISSTNVHNVFYGGPDTGRFTEEKFFLVGQNVMFCSD
jgi:hypothetical protein